MNYEVSIAGTFKLVMLELNFEFICNSLEWVNSSFSEDFDVQDEKDCE